MAHLLVQSLRPGTWKSYGTAIRKLQSLGISLPLDRSGLIKLFRAAEDHKWKASTLDMHIAAVKRAHRDCNWEPPPVLEPWAQAARKGFQNAFSRIDSGRPSRQKRPLPAVVVDHCLKVALDNEDQRERRLQATGIVVGFIFFLRGESLAGFRRDHVTFTPRDVVMQLDIEKTTHGKPARVIAFPNNPSHPLVKVLQWSLSEQVQCLVPTQNPWLLKNNTSIAMAIRMFCDECCVPDPQHYAASSLRSGGATSARFCGRSLEEIKAWGNWSFSAQTQVRYIRPQQTDPPGNDSLIPGCFDLVLPMMSARE